MRRVFASLLLVLFGFPPIAPALLAHTASGLPACCLRNGKHHCAMAEGDAPAGMALRANQPKCPLFPKAQAVTVFSKTVVFGATPVASAPHLFVAMIARPDGQFVRIGLRGSVRKRGPPAS
jgi:hypothetical protein